MLMYRWKDTNPHTVTYGQWYPWKVCSEEKAQEIRHYISQGLAYQIATYTLTHTEGYEADLPN